MTSPTTEPIGTSNMAPSNIIRLDDIDLKVEGRLLKTARLNDEHYVAASDPPSLIAGLKRRVDADIFTFVQELHDRDVHFDHRLTWDEMAVLRLTTYANWLKQIKCKPRNCLRKSVKRGVETRTIDFTDELLRGIMDIHNDTPVRQGKRNWHYGKDFETIKREHGTFLDRSEFIGAFVEEELIGFAKVTHGQHCSIVMNIVAKVEQRDKAPMNALIAKAVELVAARNIGLLNWGAWGRRGFRRGLKEFKVAHGFECLAVPRYHVPLTVKGELCMKLGLHRELKERLPEAWIVELKKARATWNEWLYGQAMSQPVARTSKATAGPSHQREP